MSPPVQTHQDADTAQGFWFGDADTPLFGWYHPAQGAIRNSGVILCPPFGHEYMVSYRSYKHLAMRLARAGFPVCFFDYDASGDSADSDTARVTSWRKNIKQAAEQLRRLSGVAQVSLFGMRLGALLAAAVADDLSAPALILFAPVVSGRAYVRELIVLRGMHSIPPSDHPQQQISDDELTGYAFDARTRTELGQLDLLKIAAPQAATMIVARDDISGQEAKLANAWHLDHRAIHLSDSSGYAAMMTEDAHESVVPHTVWNDISEWLCSQIPHKKLRSEPAVIRRGDAALSIQTPLAKHCRLPYATSILEEEIVSFAGMHGIVCRLRPAHPASNIPDNKLSVRPAIILTNVGANHRVGNHRLYVKLARRLAAQGFTVLRFDKRGIGYSLPTPAGLENDVHSSSGIDDIRSAMKFLEESYDAQQFVLGGICSGAYLSYLTAVHDERVTGLVLMNQLTFHWRHGDVIQTKKASTLKSTQFYWRAASAGDTWRRMLRGKIALRRIVGNLSKRLSRQVISSVRHSLARFMKTHHLLGRVARNFRAMQARGVELLFIFGENDSSIDLMTQHLGTNAHLLPDRDGIRIEVIRHVDHTFTPMWSQEYLTDMLAAHLAKRFPE